MQKSESSGRFKFDQVIVYSRQNPDGSLKFPAYMTLYFTGRRVIAEFGRSHFYTGNGGRR